MKDIDGYVTKDNLYCLISQIKRNPYFVVDDKTCHIITEAIGDMKTSDVQSVKHGRWEETHISLCKWIPEDEKEEGHSFYMAEMKCSCCNRYNTVTFALTLNKPDFCQHCGARMDLKGGDAE